MAKNPSRPHRYESFNHAGSICLGVLQLIGGGAVIALGVAAYRIQGELSYYGLPLWSGCAFFFTAIIGFFAARKTCCGIMTFLVTCVITTVAASGLIVLYARLLSLGSRYYFCDEKHDLTQRCLHYTSLTNLMIVEAVALGMFAMEFTTGAIGIGLCLCGIFQSGLGRTSDAPAPSAVLATAPSGTQDDMTGFSSAPTVSVSSNGANQEFQLSMEFFQHELTMPSAPPEHIVAEEQLQSPYGL